MVHPRLDHASGVLLLGLSRRLSMRFSLWLVKVHLDSSLSKTTGDRESSSMSTFYSFSNQMQHLQPQSDADPHNHCQGVTLRHYDLAFCLLRSPLSYTTNFVLKNREIYDSTDSITPKRKGITASKFLLQLYRTLHPSSWEFNYPWLIQWCGILTDTNPSIRKYSEGQEGSNTGYWTHARTHSHSPKLHPT
jgi:hypothetical protein